MAESTITTKGQCVVPKKIREYMRLNPGDKIDFVIREDGEVYVRPVFLDVRIGISFLRLRQMPHNFPHFPPVGMLRKGYHTQNSEVKESKSSTNHRNLQTAMF